MDYPFHLFCLDMAVIVITIFLFLLNSGRKFENQVRKRQIDKLQEDILVLRTANARHTDAIDRQQCSIERNALRINKIVNDLQNVGK